MNDNVSKTIEEIHIAHCEIITDESIECILLNCKNIKYLLFHSCPQITGKNRLNIFIDNLITWNFLKLFDEKK